MTRELAAIFEEFAASHPRGFAILVGFSIFAAHEIDGKLS